MTDCVFCKIINGETDTKFASLDETIVFEPLNPCTPGHVLVVPRVHVSDLAVNPQITSRVFKDVADVLGHFTDDCNVITSRGSVATQTVFHLHVHLIPRRPGDGLKLPWSYQQEGGGNE